MHKGGFMTRQPSTDAALVERLRAGDDTAVAELAARYGSKIYQLSFRYMKNREDAEEVAQDVLLKVFRKIKAFRGDAALSSWIYRITFNTAMSRLRTLRFSRPAEVPERLATRPDSEDQTPRRADVIDWTSVPDETYLRSQLRTKIHKALSTLPPIYRTPIVLRDIHGLSTEEASAALKVKSQTLKSRLHRGRLALREQLGEYANGIQLHRAA
jgi:RNA polymerase sigma-70 factor, ECF subfamily